MNQRNWTHNVGLGMNNRDLPKDNGKYRMKIQEGIIFASYDKPYSFYRISIKMFLHDFGFQPDPFTLFRIKLSRL